MRSGRVAALAGLVVLTAGCAGHGVAGIMTAPPSAPATSAAANVATGPTANPPDAVEEAESQGFRTVPSGAASDTPTDAPADEPTDAGPASRGTQSAAPGATPLPTPGVIGDGPVRVPPPKLSAYTYVFPVQGCKVRYTRRLLVLPKTTIWAKRGCRFVAPVDGTVHEVNTVDRWSPSTDRGADREGRFVSIIGTDGVRYLGGHLDAVAKGIRPGVKVKAGQVLGRVGNSGDAAGGATNLYFAVSWEAPADYWWVRRGMVKPWNYLDAWYNGNRTYSPRREMLALRKRLGATPQCTVRCASKLPQPQPTQQARPQPKPSPKKKKKTEEEIILTESED